MSYFFNSMPIGLYSIFVIIVGCIFIYGINDMKKKKPGHPFTNALYFLLVLGLYTIPYRVVQAYSQNLLLINMSSYILWVLGIVTLFAIIYFAYIAYRHNYLDEKGEQLMRTIVLPFTVVVLVGVAFIIFLYLIKIRTNQ